MGKIHSGKDMKSLKTCNGKVKKGLTIRRDCVWVCCFISPMGDLQWGLTMICGTFHAVLPCLGAQLQLWNPFRLTPEDEGSLNIWKGLWLKMRIYQTTSFHVKTIPLTPHWDCFGLFLSQITRPRLPPEESIGVMEY